MKKIPTEFMFMRQEGIVGHELLDKIDISIIGAGGIGSPTAMILAKMGCNYITVYDGDKVMPHNLPSTFYPLRAIKKTKVKALKNLIKNFTGTKISTESIMFMAEADLDHRINKLTKNSVLISAVDSMEVRKLIWGSCKKSNVGLYIEGRMGGTQGRVYTLELSDTPEFEKYETTLYSDTEVLDTPCSAKSIIFNTTLIGSLIGNQVRLWTTKQTYARDILFDLNNMNIIARNKKSEGHI